ncbi:hypothetical protein TBLA_0E03270 [Henningerozyma blattae CBS 6284]|uniref:Uncharacterized protein n=1 Tax=Henningerozyma blattae (strain ATCC 34711 / CBS 6284 / DSM 70876 / NBRC 10599 / NRRL Y-10934 / UCD 77-7) TaxID=1071380 RepID=I2H4S9_HENB6|nr:hypothetical protein TBLA_0E03270 [Tetrapisispora blattae CBS 6284]CCH61381.1 hypothetical protein TBLA_0E03270 [Tetrapisispora blattae CBS 6284]
MTGGYRDSYFAVQHLAMAHQSEYMAWLQDELPEELPATFLEPPMQYGDGLLDDILDGPATEGAGNPGNNGDLSVGNHGSGPHNDMYARATEGEASRTAATSGNSTGSVHHSMNNSGPNNNHGVGTEGNSNDGHTAMHLTGRGSFPPRGYGWTWTQLAELPEHAELANP